MNERQKLFCEYYINTFNATSSAIKAGYSKKTARSLGQRLLTNVDIQKHIQELREETKTNNIMEAIERKEFLTRIIRDNESKINDKLKALDILNKMDGEYTNKIEVKGELETNPFKNLTTEELKALIKN